MAVFKGAKGIIGVPVTVSFYGEDGEVDSVSFTAKFKYRSKKARKADASAAMKIIAKMEALEREFNERRESLKDASDDVLTKFVADQEKLTNKADQVFIDSLVGWSGLHDDEGVEVPYSEEEKANLLEHDIYFNALRDAWVKSSKSPEDALAKN